MATVPPRLHVLLAREAPVGLVLLRAPKRVFCSIGWDRESDTFQVGQWLKARIEVDRSDLSPDGRFFIYAAYDPRRWSWDTEVGDSWTAVSRVPYLKALVWAANDSTYNGGGLFTGNRTYWLATWHAPVRGSWEVEETAPPEVLPKSLYLARLQRDGWVDAVPPRFGRADLSELVKPIRDGWVLRKHVQRLWDPPEIHALVHDEASLWLDLPTWEWADVDRDRVVWTEGGCLWTGNLGDDGLIDVRMLHDFNGMQFEPLAAPY